MSVTDQLRLHSEGSNTISKKVSIVIISFASVVSLLLIILFSVKIAKKNHQPKDSELPIYEKLNLPHSYNGSLPKMCH